MVVPAFHGLHETLRLRCTPVSGIAPNYPFLPRAGEPAHSALVGPFCIQRQRTTTVKLSVDWPRPVDRCRRAVAGACQLRWRSRQRGHPVGLPISGRTEETTAAAAAGSVSGETRLRR